MLPESTTHRTCWRCREYLPFEAFGIDRSDRFGRSYACRPCASAYTRERYKARVEAQREHANPDDDRRICSGCLRELPLSAFRKDLSRRGGRTARCKECLTAQRPGVAWLRSFKETHGCEVCGETTPCCLDFHHLDPQEKERTISEFARVATVEQLKQEIEKCVVLCSNCHRKVHAGLIGASGKL